MELADPKILACVPLVKHGRSEGYNILFSTLANEDFDRYDTIVDPTIIINSDMHMILV